MVGDASGKESTCQCKRYKRHRFDPWIGKIPWSRKWQPTPVFLLGKFHGQRSLAGYSPWGCKESDPTEQLNTQLMYSVVLVSGAQCSNSVILYSFFFRLFFPCRLL